MRANIRLGALEFQTTGERGLVTDVEHTTAHIVQWENDTNCFTLAYWRRCGHGFSLTYVGSRPFDCDDWEHFQTLAAVGQKLLDSLMEVSL